MRVRRATEQDLREHIDLPDLPTMRAWVGELEDRVIAVGGLMFSKGRWYAFCELEDEARQFKFAVARAAIRIFQQARADGIRFIYARLDEDEETSERWLESLGFELDPNTEFLYRWRA